MCYIKPSPPKPQYSRHYLNGQTQNSKEYWKDSSVPTGKAGLTSRRDRKKVFFLSSVIYGQWTKSCLCSVTVLYKENLIITQPLPFICILSMAAKRVELINCWRIPFSPIQKMCADPYLRISNTSVNLASWRTPENIWTNKPWQGWLCTDLDLRNTDLGESKFLNDFTLYQTLSQQVPEVSLLSSLL